MTIDIVDVHVVPPAGHKQNISIFTVCISFDEASVRSEKDLSLLISTLTSEEGLKTTEHLLSVLSQFRWTNTFKFLFIWSMKLIDDFV